jgi:hypothetical protein
MPIVVIDAGHGGTEDVGRSTWGGGEKDLTLDVARRVVAELGGQARLTRNQDVNLSLAERAELARRQGADVFVSIHASPAERPQAFVHPRAGNGSHALARLLAPEVRREAMAVLTPERHAPATAACLLELDSLSREPARVDANGRAIAGAIRRYLGQPARALDMNRQGDIQPWATRPYDDPWKVHPNIISVPLQELANVNPQYANVLEIAVVTTTRNGMHVFAGSQDDFVSDVGELALLAPLYAAFELRQAVRDVAMFSVWAGAPDLWKQCAKELDPQIVAARDARIVSKTLPSYATIFEAKPDRSVDFTATFSSALDDMFTFNSATHSKLVIDALGFGYINAALAAGGFFDPTTDRGLWLTGNFVDPPQLILTTTSNQKLTPYGATPRAVAKLMTQLLDRRLVSELASDEMNNLLVGSAKAKFPYITQFPSINPNGAQTPPGFDVSADHLGVLAGPCEASIVRRTADRRPVVAAWQNFTPVTQSDLGLLTRFVDLVVAAMP